MDFLIWIFLYGFSNRVTISAYLWQRKTALVSKIVFANVLEW